MCSPRNDNIHTYSIYLVFIIAKHLILLMSSPFLRKKKEKAKNKTKQKTQKQKQKNKKEKQKRKTKRNTKQIKTIKKKPQNYF